MARTGFLNDNANRDYPLLRGASFAPLSAVVGCGFLVGPNTGFQVGVHQVLLDRIARQGTELQFYFTSDAPGLVGRFLCFRRQIDDPPYALEHLTLPAAEPDSLSIASLSSGFSLSSSASASDSGGPPDTPQGDCGIADLLTGFLITGPLEDLVADLADGAAISGPAGVEPALVQSLTNAYARTLNLANADRTRYQPPTGCGDASVPTALYVRQTCLTGKIVFVPGYNTLILQNEFDNSLTFSAAVGAGAGEPCQQVPVYAGETPPAGSLYLEGGPSCNEVVRQVGGASGPLVTLTAGAGIQIDYQPGSSRIVLTADLHDLAICGSELLTADAAYAACVATGHGVLTTAAARLAGYGVSREYLTAGGALATAAAQLAGSGVYVDGIVGSGALLAPAATGAGGSNFVETFAAAGVLLAAPATAAGAGSYASQFWGAGGPTTAAPTTAGSGTFVPAVATIIGVGYLVTQPVSVSNTGSFSRFVAYVANGASSSIATTSRFSIDGQPQVWADSGGPGQAYAFGGAGGSTTDVFSSTTRKRTFGDIPRAGGNGSAYSANYGGGGGGGAGPDAGDIPRAGNNATNNLGGAAVSPANAGAGGNGQYVYGAGPQNGVAPGGGGGGVSAWAPPTNPGTGAVGQVRLTYDGGSQTFSTPGYHSVVFPDGTTTVTAECWGAGGAGEIGVVNVGFDGSGGGGGGGAYAKSQLTLDENWVVVGKGASYTTPGVPDNVAEPSYVIYRGNLVCWAAGGADGDAGGLGGSAAHPAALGDVLYSGGNGFAVAPGGVDGGGGGSSASQSANGYSATSSTGVGQPPTGLSGQGGTGVHLGQLAGANGSAPGGGGGGRGSRSATPNPGKGGAGRVTITLTGGETTALTFTTPGTYRWYPPGDAVQAAVACWGGGGRGGFGIPSTPYAACGGGGGGAVSTTTVFLE